MNNLPQNKISLFDSATVIVCGRITGHDIKHADKLAGFLQSNKSDMRAIASPFYIDGKYSFSFPTLGQEDDSIVIQFYNNETNTYHELSPSVVVRTNDSINGPNILGSLDQHYMFQFSLFTQTILFEKNRLKSFALLVDQEYRLNDIFTTNVLGDTIWIDSTTYDYSNAWPSEAKLIPGQGYWAKFNQSYTLTLSGPQVVDHSQTISFEKNRLKSFALRVDKEYLLNDIFTTNVLGDTIWIDSTTYDYSNGWPSQAKLIPGQGYWAKFNQSFDLSLS